MKIFSLAWHSLVNRKFTVLLTMLSIAMSVALILGVEKIRHDARLSFTNTISGTDLIVGARSGPTQLLLYSVFRIGNATNNISWQSYQDIVAHKAVAWSVPLSLGDSHRGFRLLGTTRDYFKHYRYGRKQSLVFAQGMAFDDLFDVVLGAVVAEELGHRLGDDIVVSHGSGKVTLQSHDDKPFRVVGILAHTGTPIDRTVHVSLPAIEAIHLDWQQGVPSQGPQTSADEARAMDLQPKAITAFLVGLKSKLGIFALQRSVNEYDKEPLLAILPGVALQELWELMGVAETALLGISVLVVISGLIGMVAVILAGLNERRREMAILRSVGARPHQVFGLFTVEAGLITLVGVLSGVVMLYVIVFLLRPVIESEFGLYVPIEWLGTRDLSILGVILLAGFAVGAIPAYRAYRYSLHDGMSIRT